MKNMELDENIVLQTRVIYKKIHFACIKSFWQKFLQKLGIGHI